MQGRGLSCRGRRGKSSYCHVNAALAKPWRDEQARREGLRRSGDRANGNGLDGGVIQKCDGPL